MQVHVRVCKECGEEYRPDIVECADCGGELKDVFEDEDGPGPREDEAAAESVDLTHHRPLVQTRRAADLVPLAERLKETEIPFRLVEETEGGAGTARYALVVHEDEAKGALEALADLVAPHEEGDGVAAVETHYESGRYVKCPACGTEQGSGLGECAECGLTLAPPVPACPRCEAPLEEEGAACTVCGGPSPTG